MLCYQICIVHDVDGTNNAHIQLSFSLLERVRGPLIHTILHPNVTDGTNQHYYKKFCLLQTVERFQSADVCSSGMGR
jgi:hypothetical protein